MADLLYPDGVPFVGFYGVTASVRPAVRAAALRERTFGAGVSPKRQSPRHTTAHPARCARRSSTVSAPPSRALSFLAGCYHRLPGVLASEGCQGWCVVCGAWAGYPERCGTLEACCCLSSASRTRTPSRSVWSRAQWGTGLAAHLGLTRVVSPPTGFIKGRKSLLVLLLGMASMLSVFLFPRFTFQGTGLPQCLSHSLGSSQNVLHCSLLKVAQFDAQVGQFRWPSNGFAAETDSDRARGWHQGRNAS